MEEMQSSRHGLCAPHHPPDPLPPSTPRPVPGSRGIMFDYPPSADDWEIIKSRVHQMYVIHKQPLKDVRKTLDRLGFRATDRMIKSRLRTWGFVKNAKKEDWGLLAVLHHRRKISGRPATVFEIHGHRKTVRDLHRFIRNQAKSAEEFLADHLPQWHHHPVPEYIRAWTPDPEDAKADSPPSAAESPDVVPSPRAAKPASIAALVSPDSMVDYRAVGETYRSGPRPLSPEPSCYHHPNYLPGSDAGAPPGPLAMTKSASHPRAPEVPTQIPTPPPHDPEPCHFMEAELKACGTQLLEPQRLTSRIGRDDMQFWSWLSTRQCDSGEVAEDMDDVQICTRCRQPSFQHFRSLDNFEPVLDSPSRNLLNDCHDETWHLPVSTSDEGVWLWVSRCFFACMCFSRGDEKMGHAALSDAAAHFERLLSRQDRLLLTGAMLMNAILHMHDQDKIARKVAASVKDVTDRIFPDPQHPMRTTMTYFFHTAAGNIRSSGITSADLADAHRRFRDMHRDDHPYVIAARCNYAWMLKFEDKLDLAEQTAREVYKDSCAVFTDRHMQSVIALCMVAGCLYPQPQRQDECIRLFQDVADTTVEILGVNHPYRLEVRRRQADRLALTPGNDDRVLGIHKEVLWGRAKMLGRKHTYTLGARDRYESDLRRLQRWEVDGEASPEQRELLELFTRDPAEAWATGGPDPVHGTPSVASLPLADEHGRPRLSDSRSRTPSPASSDDYAAY